MLRSHHPPSRASYRAPHSRAFSTHIDVECRLHAMARAFRAHGHKEAQLDPLGLLRPTQRLPELNPATYGLHKIAEPVNIDGIVSLGGKNSQSKATIPEIEAHLRRVYCGLSTAQIEHVSTSKEYAFLSRALEAAPYREFSGEERKEMLRLVTEAEAFDHFMQKKFPTVKRYGCEGAESLLVAMKTLLAGLKGSGVETVVLGMPHRGRLNLMTSLLGLPPAAVFSKCRGSSELPAGFEGTADVLSHLQLSSEVPVGSSGAETIHVSLLPNPSHLEAINPVAVGKARAKQAEGQAAACVLVHGDAAYAGQGIVAETFTMANLPGYTVGGTVHLIVNNQLGFTTTPEHGRSSRYSADLAKMIGAPIIHVNADHPEEVARAMEVAVQYRSRFQRDIVVDMIGYRRWGHNELDEPAFTQPSMYRAVRAQASVPSLYAQSLSQAGIVSESEFNALKEQSMQRLEEEFKRLGEYTPVQTFLQKQWSGIEQAKNVSEWGPTGVPVQTLKEVALHSVSVPEDFTVHERLQKYHIDARRQAIEKEEPVDWATAEAMAMGTLLQEGVNVRLSGQDVGRGTFSHRHMRLIDQTNDRPYVPFETLPGRKGRVEVFNSPLSESSVFGFEYGVSLDNPRNLAIWEAQFGDFANVPQMMIDNLLASGEDKWLLQSGMVVLLPHGMDGTGPEHSSGRMERFLQLCNGNIMTDEPVQAKVNMHVVNPTTPANYFHVLRRQIHRPFRKPLIVMSPKILLKHAQAVSRLEEMGPGTRFQAVLGDAVAERQAAGVEKVVLVCGKIFYDLVKERETRGAFNTAFIRMEELSPFPYQQLAAELAKYPNAKKMIWAQEEHENQGGFTYVEPRLRRFYAGRYSFDYVGRASSSVSATGLSAVHKKEIADILDGVFA